MLVFIWTCSILLTPVIIWQCYRIITTALEKKAMAFPLHVTACQTSGSALVDNISHRSSCPMRICSLTEKHGTLSGRRSPPYSFIQTSAPIQDVKFDDDPLALATMFETCLLNPETSDASFVERLIQANMVESVLKVVGQFSGLSVAGGVNMISGEGISHHHPNILLVEDFLIGVIMKSPGSWSYETLPPFRKKASEARLFGMMMWDGWLKQDPNLALEARKRLHTLRHALMSVTYQIEQRPRVSDAKSCLQHEA